MKQTSGTPEIIRQKHWRIKKTLWKKLKRRTGGKIAGGEGVAIIERDLTADSWQSLLGYKLTMELITEAHDNAKRFKQLLKEEALEHSKKRQLKIQENKNARKQLARGASAAT